jgi:hypothetical protein
MRANLEKKREEDIKFSLNKSKETGNLVYRPTEGDKSEKTMMTDDQIEKIANTIGDITEYTSAKKGKNNKKKKPKK